MVRYPKWFAKWRLQVWDNRLTDWRKEWNQTTVAGPNQLSPLSSVNEEQFWERLVTKALLKRTKWRKVKGPDGAYLLKPEDMA